FPIHEVVRSQMSPFGHGSSVIGQNPVAETETQNASHCTGLLPYHRNLTLPREFLEQDPKKMLRENRRAQLMNAARIDLVEGVDLTAVYNGTKAIFLRLPNHVACIARKVLE